MWLVRFGFECHRDVHGLEIVADQSRINVGKSKGYVPQNGKDGSICMAPFTGYIMSSANASSEYACAVVANFSRISHRTSLEASHRASVLERHAFSYCNN